MRKRIKQVSAFVLAIALICSTCVLTGVYAADRIDTTAECVMEVSVASTAYAELNGTEDDVTPYPMTVKIYKVADIDAAGEYTPVAPYDEIVGFKDEVKAVDSETTAAEWTAMAELVQTVAKEETPIDTQEASAATSAMFTGLATGLYLVDAQEVVTPEYRYIVAPFLVSLPNNYFYTNGNTTDVWDYDLIDKDTEDAAITNAADRAEEAADHALDLKPQQFPRYGYLVIEKELKNYNVTNPSGVFVFEIETTKDDFTYNDVVALDFTNPGTDSLRVGPIEAGADVTVKEVYTGAGYELAEGTAGTLTAKIVANTHWDTCYSYKEAKAAGLPADTDTNFVKVSFENEHNDVPNGGTGVVNTFKVTGEKETMSWTWSKEYQGQTDPAAAPPTSTP